MTNSDHPYTSVAYYFYFIYGGKHPNFFHAYGLQRLSPALPLTPLQERMGWNSPETGCAAQEGHTEMQRARLLLGFFGFVFFCFWCRLKVQNMLEHGKKGICLSDSDMFQHFPTGSCTSQNNCNPGSCPLAYDYICIMLQESGQPSRTHMGVVGMHSPEWRPCCLAGLGTATEQAQKPQQQDGRARHSSSPQGGAVVKATCLSQVGRKRP